MKHSFTTICFTFGFDSGKYDSYHNRNGDRFYFGDSEGQTAWGTSYLEEVQNDSDKSEEIFNPFLTLVMIDLICCIVIPFPVFAMLWAVYCVFCEFKSVREKSWEKAELRKAEKTMSIIIENKDDIARLAAQYCLKHKRKGG